MRACARARWNFLSPNSVKSKLKGRMSLCTLRPDLSSCNYCWFVVEPIRLCFWLCRLVDLRRRFSALRASVSERRLRAAWWWRPRCGFAPAAPKRRLHPLTRPSLLARGTSSPPALGVYTQPPRKGQLLNKEPSIMARR